jgi:translation initiation factor 2B subunit (eIF-2B alpha/beta/delta family)/D-arabinose 5-phosphate isomerase GutQ
MRMPEKRFEYGEALARAGYSPADDSTMHFLWQIVDEGVLGASRHVALSIELLRHILDSTPDAAEAWARARLAADFIAETRGRDTPVIGNSLAALLASLEAVPETSRPKLLKERAERWTAEQAARKERLVGKAAKHLAEARGIMAFDYSSSVSAIVQRLCTGDRPPLVVVPESRSIAGGAKYLDEFLPAGIPVRFIPDAAIEHGLVECDTVLLGVETLRADGSFLNTIGSRMIARIARPLGIEVYGCTDLMKLDRRSYDGHRPSPAFRSYDAVLLSGRNQPGRDLVDTSGPELEVIPADLTTALLTEFGPVPPQAIWGWAERCSGHRSRQIMNETMQREIRAQAEVLPSCLSPLADAVGAVRKPEGRIFAGGCGDSAFAPAALAEVFRSLDLDVRATTAMDLAGYCPLRPTDTVVLSSISGGTRRTVEAALAARHAGARVVALTCRDDSDLAALADHLVLLPFTPISRKTPHTLDYLVTLQALAMLALAWAGRDPRSLGVVLDVLHGGLLRLRVRLAKC